MWTSRGFALDLDAFARQFVKRHASFLMAETIGGICIRSPMNVAAASFNWSSVSGGTGSDAINSPSAS